MRALASNHKDTTATSYNPRLSFVRSATSRPNQSSVIVPGQTPGHGKDRSNYSRKKKTSNNKPSGPVTVPKNPGPYGAPFRPRPVRRKCIKSDTVTDESHLSPGQSRCIDAIREGKSVFFTGAAGTGKSFLMNHILKNVVDVDSDGVYVTAMTGTCAVMIKGSTLHSFAGVGLGKGTPSQLAGRMKPAACERWRSCQLLFVDEGM
jgi:Cdc6-like AAA superfamily ATPase